MAFIFASRWIDRLLGFASTLVLARLLTPEDFGVIAMAMLVVGFAEIVFDLGVGAALIRIQSPSVSHYNSGWTLKIVQGFLMALTLIFTAELIAEYFQDDRVSLAVYILAVSIFLASFENIGIVRWQKNLEFDMEFRFLVMRRLVGFLVTLGLALILRSFMALVLGVLIGRLAGVALSYALNDYRPRYDYSKVRDLLSVSVWMVFKNIATYLDANFHKLFLGGKSNARSLGGYSLAAEIADMPGTEILSPVNRMLFPLLVDSLRKGGDGLNIMVLAQSFHVLMVFPLCVGLSILAESVVGLLLGGQWGFIAPFLSVMAYFNIVNSVTSALNYYCMAQGRFWVPAVVSVLQLMVFAVILIPTFHGGDYVWVAESRLMALVMGVLFTWFIFLRLFPKASIYLLFKACIRPAIGVLIMSQFLIQMLQLEVFDVIDWFRMLALVMLGGLVYSLTIVVQWLMIGRPYGPEYLLLKKMRIVK